MTRSGIARPGHWRLSADRHRPDFLPGFRPGPFGGENGIKTLRIEVEQIRRVPRLLQSCQCFSADRGMEAVVERMAIDVQHAHHGSIFAKLRILPGLSKPYGSTSCLNPSWSASTRL